LVASAAKRSPRRRVTTLCLRQEALSRCLKRVPAHEDDDAAREQLRDRV
jgi:hypothetical protein